MHSIGTHFPLGVRHPLEHRQRDYKRSIPNGGWRYRGNPFRYRLLRLRPLVIHPLILEYMAADYQLAVSFSGHRKERIIRMGNPYIDAQIRYGIIMNVIRLYEQGYKVYYNGMANGFDLVSAQVILMLKRWYSDIHLIAVVPFKSQSVRYDGTDKTLYDEILKQADEVKVLSENYYKGCFLRRNNYMIERSDKIILFWDGEQKGGTYYTAMQAQRKNIEYINLYK